MNRHIPARAALTSHHSNYAYRPQKKAVAKPRLSYNIRIGAWSCKAANDATRSWGITMMEAYKHWLLVGIK